MSLQNQTNEQTTRRKFSVTTDEIVIAALSFLLGYAYISDTPFSITCVLLMIIGFTEYLNRKKTITKENIFYMICFAVCAVCFIIGVKDNSAVIWDQSMLSLFTHCFAIWYVMNRSQKLVEEKSSVYFPIDMINGMFVIPLSNLFLRIGTIGFSLVHLFQGKEERKRNYWFIPAIVICVSLFVSAANLLASSDVTFAKVVEKFTDLFRLDFDDFLLVLSLPVGAYLYGLIGGSYRYKQERLSNIKTAMEDLLSSVRKIPAWFWLLVVSSFSLMYIFYFFLQGSYLFGAFTHHLPEGFIVSRYAVQGFWELCRIMAVNAAVLYIVTRMADEAAQTNKYFRFACIFLLAESVVFAIIALSKIFLYISIFGFTPKRLQGFWLVIVLLAGCVLWMINILKGKKTFAIWMYFIALTLTLTCLYGLF